MKSDSLYAHDLSEMKRRVYVKWVLMQKLAHLANLDYWFMCSYLSTANDHWKVSLLASFVLGTLLRLDFVEDIC